MTAAWAKRLRGAHLGAWYVLATALVLVAIGAVVLAQLALPWVERNPRAVAVWLSERAGRPVAFDTLDTEWTRRGPLLRVTGLRIGAPDVAVPVERAEIQVAPYAGLLPGRSLTELRLHGLALTLEREDDGRWHVRGLPGAARPDDDPLDALQGLGELQVVDAQLSIDAPSLALRHVLPRVDLRMRVDRRRVRAAARAWIEADGAPLDLRLDLQRADGDGRAYVAMPRNELQVWSPLLAPSGIAIREGHGGVAVWLDLDERRVVAATADVALDRLALQRASDVAQQQAEAPTVTFDGMQARLHWHHADGDWRLDAPRLRIVQHGRAQTLDGLAVAGGAHWALRAARVEVAPLLALAALADGASPALRAWLQAAAPHAVVSDLAVAVQRNGRARLSARIDDLGFAPVSDRPGLEGLSGTLTGDAAAVVFRPDPTAAPVFDWPVGFGVPHPLQLTGDVVGWRDADGWHVDTPGLRIEGDGYAADARGGLAIDHDGSRPRLDLAVRVDTAQIPVAKKFWVRHEMPEAARNWLDMALVAGEVQGGRAIVSGDLDDWPFGANEGRDRKGVFAAEARLVDATIRFDDEWPAMDALSGRLRFRNDGFTLDEATGALAGVPVRDIAAGMTRYASSPVQVQAGAATDAARLLTLLRASPLHAEHAETLDALDVAGPARVRMALAVPPGAPVRLDGTVALDGVRMRETRFDLAFDDVRGEARFDQAGFRAEDLSVHQDGQAGRLALRAGDGHVRDRAQAFEGELDIALAASALLARAPDLAWLRPHVDGIAPWRVQVTIPNGAPAGGPAARLLLRSDLVGTALRLPAPLDKPAAVPLRTTIEAPIPFEGGDIAVGFGNRLAVRARSRDDRTGVRVEFGSARVQAAPPATGLAIAGRTPVVDLVDWLGLMGGDGEGLALQALDLTTADMRLPGARLGQTRLTAARVGGATALRLDGSRLAGDVRLPDADGAPVVVALQRLHWPALAQVAPAAATPSAPPPARAPADDGLDPGAVPPVQLTVDDLRIGELALGRVEARSRPGAGGLVLDHLRIRAPQHRIDASGRWTGRGTAARTAVEVDVESEDFGRLLSGLGFAGSIVGGQGRVDFDTAWPGPPAAFDIAALQGSLQLTVKDGQLVEVDPGAGRVLGLLSLTELPRRLTLDFRDFFNRGFGFNRIAGDIRFGSGQARSDGVTIDGPAAEIRIRGSADLQARTHDQTIEVLPKTGNLLPAVGALTAGPVGAAVGAVANAVLRRPLAEMGARNYHVSGPWQDPKVEVVERRDSAQTPPARPPASRPQAAD
ncbi:YhdP family protein [Luteimonas sp BLCC-B24]|uniref:YhdP family protein n=1 Tax=Luteimonas sp. BLCC-B24 TaxID=3025317 RepID=UPI00234C18D6|nr:YhdP family protein [Luteimonas sp. BLCC-B24]MDC7806534.1 YhdP family protein [Luteimonas sp. BLCC-B24]